MSVGTVLLIYFSIGFILSLIYSVKERLETNGKGYDDDIPIAIFILIVWPIFILIFIYQGLVEIIYKCLKKLYQKKNK